MHRHARISWSSKGLAKMQLKAGVVTRPVRPWKTIIRSSGGHRISNSRSRVRTRVRQVRT